MKVSRKILTGLILATAVTATAASIADLNNEIARRLRGINNAKTVATTVFKQLAAPEKGKFVLDGASRYRKTGSKGFLELNLQRVTFDTINSRSPSFLLVGSAAADLAQFATREDLDAMVETIEDVLNGLAKDYLAEYGDAAQVRVQISQKTKDASGHYNLISGVVSLNIDLNKLPPNRTKESVSFLSAEFLVTTRIAADLKTSIQASVNLRLNPLNPSVRDENGEVQAYIKKLLALDKATLDNLENEFRGLDATIERELN